MNIPLKLFFIVFNAIMQVIQVFMNLFGNDNDNVFPFEIIIWSLIIEII